MFFFFDDNVGKPISSEGVVECEFTGGSSLTTMKKSNAAAERSAAREKIENELV